MRPLLRWTTPDRLMATRYDDRWRFDEPMPRVIIVADRLKAEVPEVARLLVEAGYRYLEPDEFLRAHRFVRGLWLWWLHRVGCWLWQFGLRSQRWWESPADGTPF
jgi:hypothetical protein